MRALKVLNVKQICLTQYLHACKRWGVYVFLGWYGPRWYADNGAGATYDNSGFVGLRIRKPRTYFRRFDVFIFLKIPFSQNILKVYLLLLFLTRGLNP